MSGLAEKSWTLAELGRANEAWTTSLPQTLFSTLAGVATSGDSGAGVTVNLALDGSDSRHPVLTGTAETKLALVCQRCLTEMDYVLKTNINAAFVRDDSAAANDAADVWVVEESGILLQAVIEEALLMALPLAPKHADTDCAVNSASLDENDASPKRLPFAGLREMLEEDKEH